MDLSRVDALEQQLINEAFKQLNVSVHEWNRGDLATIISRHMEILVTSKKVSLASLASKLEVTVTEVCQAACSRAKQMSGQDKLRRAVARNIMDYVIHLCNLYYLAIHLERHLDQISSERLRERQIPVFSSEWIEHLRSRGILLDPVDELDWSGRGQHVEYEPKDEKYIPLKTEAVLGHSAKAIVESVRCRRIKLARKRIRCSQRLTKEIVITEVENLHRLQHAHIVRVVGTYTLKKDLAILLYPATPWNLDEFMDELLDTGSMVNEDVLDNGTWRRLTALRSFFGCLANALEAIHKMNIKHMDIKPKNLLVRPYRTGKQSFKVYIADFGIARAYKSANESETDSPISFTRMYAAPEVILQETRGFSADVFSLGCVFMEMLATLVSKPGRNERQTLVDVRKSHSGDSSFHANLTAVQSWYQEAFLAELDSGPDHLFLPRCLLDVVPEMVQSSPTQRPLAAALEESLGRIGCNACHKGPEPFEAADSVAD
jgi:serine/threonine protein kinase